MYTNIKYNRLFNEERARRHTLTYFAGVVKGEGGDHRGHVHDGEEEVDAGQAVLPVPDLRVKGLPIFSAEGGVPVGGILGFG